MAKRQVGLIGRSVMMLALIASCGQEALPLRLPSLPNESHGAAEPVSSSDRTRSSELPSEPPSQDPSAVEQPVMVCGPLRETVWVSAEEGSEPGVIAAPWGAEPPPPGSGRPMLVQKTVVRRLYVVELGEVAGTGTASDHRWRSIVLQNLAAMRQCLCAHPKDAVDAPGRLRLVVDRQGRVVQASAVAPNPELERCIADEAHRWSMPANELEARTLVLPLRFIYDPEPHLED
jgi:hypothetical protein